MSEVADKRFMDMARGLLWRDDGGVVPDAEIVEKAAELERKGIRVLVRPKDMPTCVKCGGTERLEPFNYDGKIGVPMCIDCRREWFANGTAVPRPKACPTCGTPEPIYEAVEASIEGDGTKGGRILSLKDLTKADVLAERERCAKIADAVMAAKEKLVTTSDYPDAHSACVEIAHKIRRGGE